MVLMFVCTGNTCRSIMAGALAARELKRTGLTGIKVISAGTGAVPGLPASAHAIGVMDELQIDIKSHRSSRLDIRAVEKADLILTMTESHRRAVIDICPGAASRVHTLAEYAGAVGDVPDPFGGDAGIYRHTAEKLKSLVGMAVARLLKEQQ